MDFRNDGTEGEEILGLGATNRVWRVGNTIRRSRGPWSETTAALLHHLEQRCFGYSPRHLGVDGLGRDVLSVMAGTPLTTLRGDDQLIQLATLLREFHDASADFIPPTDAIWRVPPVAGAKGGGRIIHRDVAAWNLLETGPVITGLVDWDLAGPG